MNALASQCHSDVHKGNWQDGLRQSNRIITSIRHLSLLGEACMVKMCALIKVILEGCIPTDLQESACPKAKVHVKAIIESET